MKTRSSRRELMKVFGFDTWAELQENLREAQEPFPIALSFRCLVKGRRRLGYCCVFAEGIKENDSVDSAFVIEHYSYIRFKGSRTIWRYLNPDDMRSAIQEFDRDGIIGSLDDGDIFVLEPLAKNAARSLEYARQRRENIKNGKHIVKPRGPNPNMRRISVHHFRPY